MSDGILSQDEIDALLRGGSSEPGAASSKATPETDVQAIGEILRLAMAATAEGIGLMTGQEGRADVREIGVHVVGDLDARLSGGHVVVESGLSGEADGILFTLFPLETARVLGELAGGETSEEGVLPDAFGEIVAEITLHLSDALSQGLGVRVELDPASPREVVWQPGEAPPVPVDPDERVVFAECRLVIGDTVLSVNHMIPWDVAAWMADSARRAASARPAAERMAGAAGATPFAKSVALAAAEEPVQERRSPAPSGPVRRTPQGAQISTAQFAQLDGEPQRAYGGNIDLLLDVPLQVTVELGRTRMQIREVLELGKGSVVELDKLAGEPVEIYVNGKLIARGEVVTIDENFGVKITDIVSRKERVSNLQ